MCCVATASARTKRLQHAPRLLPCPGCALPPKQKQKKRRRSRCGSPAFPLFAQRITLPPVPPCPARLAAAPSSPAARAQGCAPEPSSTSRPFHSRRFSRVCPTFLKIGLWVRRLVHGVHPAFLPCSGRCSLPLSPLSLPVQGFWQRHHHSAAGEHTSERGSRAAFSRQRSGGGGDARQSPLFLCFPLRRVPSVAAAMEAASV